jgi:predicted HAD superfamily phosphohydrolase YqeG
MKKNNIEKELPWPVDATVLLDIDGTVIPSGGTDEDISHEIFAWIRKLKEWNNRIYLCSNNKDHQRNKMIAIMLNIPYLETSAKKPFKSALGNLKFRDDEYVVVIGDKFLTDGLFAHNIGATFKKAPRLVSHKTPFVERFSFVIDDAVSFIAGDVLEKKEPFGDCLFRFSLERQDLFGLVHKRWMLGALKDSFEAGRRTIEMDLRMDSEHKFWVSHATGVRASFFPSFIHKMTTKEMKEKGCRESLEHVLEIFSKYKDRGHRLILEIKSLGNDPEKFCDRARELQKTLTDAGAENAVAVASLSPGILLAIHEVMPSVPLILNGGIQPFISYSSKGIFLGDKKWKTFGIPYLGEMIISDGVIPSRADGEGTHTAYGFTHLPEKLVEVMKAQRDVKIKFGGYVSLSAVTTVTSIMDLVGMHKRASTMRKKYAKIITDLGLGIQVTTWGQSLSKIPGFKHLDPQTQVEMFKRELGPDTIIYTKNPEEWAYKLELEG